MLIRKFFLFLLLILFILPVSAAIGWGNSEIVFLSSTTDDSNHVGSGISEMIFLSSMEEVFHIGEGISEIVLLSSLHYGDVDNNSEVESLDASLILQYVIGFDPAPAAPLPWEDWRITVADVSGSGSIGAYDAALILRYVLDLIDIFPVEGEPIIDRVRIEQMKREFINSQYNNNGGEIK